MADHVDESSGAVNSQPGSSKVATSARLGFEERSYTSDLICQNETNESNDGLNDIIEECRILIGNAQDSTWSKRQKLSHVKWGENREKIMETLLKEQFLEDKEYSQEATIS
eukprot:gene21021-23074_t